MSSSHPLVVLWYWNLWYPLQISRGSPRSCCCCTRAGESAGGAANSLQIAGPQLQAEEQAKLGKITQWSIMGTKTDQKVNLRVQLQCMIGILHCIPTFPTRPQLFSCFSGSLIDSCLPGELVPHLVWEGWVGGTMALWHYGSIPDQLQGLIVAEQRL